jgi:hypothetical protein
MGTPARVQVSASAARSYRDRVHPLAQPLAVAVAVGIAGAAATIALEQPLYLVAVALLSLFAYAVAQGTIGGVARRRASTVIELAGTFDRLIESAARELPEAALARLTQIKTQLVRLLAEMPALRQSGIFAGDDEHFVRQAIARYVPDALTPYLALPAERRTRGASAEEIPERLLNEQLELLSRKLDSLVQRADEAQVERLRRNRTFLDRKIG